MRGTEPAHPAQARPARILIADDDAGNVTLLRRTLAGGGYADVHATTDPARVIAEMAAVDPDLLLLDWHMPAPHGADVLAALREDPRWADRPVIVVTADPDARLRALEFGATDFLTKPFDRPEILLRVRNVLRIRMLHLELQSQNDELERRVHERTRELEVANATLRHAEVVRRDFVTMASHEMRTPLTVIRGFAELWSTRGLPSAATGREQVAALRRNTRRLEHLVHNLLLAARVETGSEGHRRRRFRLDEALEAEALGTSSVNATVDCDVTGRFEGDPELLSLVVGNLVSNAERYGAPPIEVRATEIPGGIEVSVTDHGPGVPEHFVPRLFDRFTQASSGDRRTAQGAGLGLWVSQRIAELHGGRLWYEPAPGGGARFTLRLPRPEFR